jgi:hypothetical protein
MDIWNNDPVKNFAQKYMVQLGQSDDLPKTISGFELSRDDNFKLTLKVGSSATDSPKMKEMPLGHVYISNNTVELKGGLGSGLIDGVSLQHVHTELSPHNRDTATTSRYSINRVEYKFSDKPINFTLDRIANLPSHYHWPDGFKEEKSSKYKRTFTGEPPITIEVDSPGLTNLSSSCARLSLGGHTVLIGTMESEEISKAKNPGYIFYTGSPDRATREAIRNSLAFAFGVPLVHFGSCFYTDSGNLIAFEALTPMTMGDRAWSIPSQPFAPITSDHYNLDISKLEILARAFFDNYDKHCLRNFLFRLWYAESSPYFMKPAYYGSMIETIQKRQIKNTALSISHTILPVNDYKKIKKTLTKFLQKQKVDANLTRLLQYKIDNGNDASQRVIADRFYTVLGLPLGRFENTAWNKRNDAAHGNEIISGGEIDLIRQTKILRVVLARIILKLISGSEYYIDYYTYDHPVRNLDEAIPETPLNA